MRKALCKVFAFLLSLASQLVDLIANTLIKIGTAIVEVLSEVVGAAGSALLRSPLAIGAGLLLLVMLWPSKSKSDERDEPANEVVLV